MYLVMAELGGVKRAIKNVSIGFDRHDSKSSISHLQAVEMRHATAQIIIIVVFFY